MMMKWSAYYLQDCMSFSGESLNNLMDWVTTMMISILIAVVWFYYSVKISKSICNYIIENQSVEFLWTVFPLFILMFMASISLKSLYTEEHYQNLPCMNLNVTGHQWYWEYYYPDFNLMFDSYLQEWESSLFRLSECDNRVVLPINAMVRVSVSSADVIHSWAIPSLGIKMDATPGRIISTMMVPLTPTLVYGLCAELCGANHSFMPIVIEYTSVLLFKNWVNMMSKI
uniref:cytochrome c oxidase subunit II n=1 Tax=Aonchotheca putorii TaxID=1647945 RepID=UPI00237A988E|nr:cytochrome c oxidase subunit II [Aonchotheca putorii]WBV76989.1 cytochrome c oxidase subunit 2 [Aonchotheca putorii]